MAMAMAASHDRSQYRTPGREDGTDSAGQIAVIAQVPPNRTGHMSIPARSHA
jgi:hypothetical protein